MFFQAEDGIRDVERSRGLGDVYKRQIISCPEGFENFKFSFKNVGQISTNIFYMRIVLIDAPVSGLPIYNSAHVVTVLLMFICV